jgi:hypothetical protein
MLKDKEEEDEGNSTTANDVGDHLKLLQSPGEPGSAAAPVTWRTRISSCSSHRRTRISRYYSHQQRVQVIGKAASLAVTGISCSRHQEKQDHQLLRALGEAGSAAAHPGKAGSAVAPRIRRSRISRATAPGTRRSKVPAAPGIRRSRIRSCTRQQEKWVNHLLHALGEAESAAAPGTRRSKIRSCFRQEEKQDKQLRQVL